MIERKAFWVGGHSQACSNRRNNLLRNIVVGRSAAAVAADGNCCNCRRWNQRRQIVVNGHTRVSLLGQIRWHRLQKVRQIYDHLAVAVVHLAAAAVDDAVYLDDNAAPTFYRPP